MKPAEHDKPQIAIWFLSHLHGDHMDLPMNFLKDYTNKVDLDVLAFNFPEPESSNMVEWRQSIMEDFQKIAKEDYGADVWVMHTGQVMEFPGATIEVLSTVEDLYCEGAVSSLTKEIDINNTCIVFRVTIGGTSFMVLGDAYPTTCQFMADAYGDALQSDILQVSHHGYNGAVIDLYQDIDPKICLWPCDEFVFYTNSMQIGTENGYYKFNWWLRNTPWKRGTKTGTRTHYVTSYTTTIDAATGIVTKP
jgi:beta-lactamase superfamily II metal-dependent hydrolase